MSDESLDYLFENTSGSPTKVMRMMRDAVDYERSNPREMKYDTPPKEITQEPQEEDSKPEINITEDEINVSFDLDYGASSDVHMSRLCSNTLLD